MAEPQPAEPEREPDGQPPAPPPTLPIDVVRRLLENQAQELAIRQQELSLDVREVDLRQQQDTHQFRYATAALEAKAKDSVHQRETHSQWRRLIVIAILVAVVVLFSGLVTLALVGAKDLALEIVKILGTAVASGLGGYGFGRTRSAKGESADEEPAAAENDPPARRRRP